LAQQRAFGGDLWERRRFARRHHPWSQGGAASREHQSGSKQTTTDQTGEFLFPLLPVGEYRITVEQSGFKRYEQIGLLLQVNDNVKVDVRLEVGELSTSVTVEASERR